MRMRSMPLPRFRQPPRGPRMHKSSDRPKVPAPGLVLLFMPDNSGGIVGLGGARRVGAPRAGLRLGLASLEILSQRHAQAPLLPHLLRALSPIVHGCQIMPPPHPPQAFRPDP